MSNITHPPGRRPRYTLVVLLAAIALLAAACGGGGSGDSGDGSSAGGDQENGTEEEALEPQPGGEVVYGIEADTAGAWTPEAVVCAVACQQVMRSVYDPLVSSDENGEIHGVLLDSFEPNDDFTEWTLTVRDGIQFHDGTPLDGAAVADNLDRQRNGARRGTTLVNISDVSADGQIVTVTLTEPDSGFLRLFTGGPASYIASPTWLEAVDAGTADATEPIGTGPFVYEEYQSGVSFSATKNPDYWQAGLPYLDAIEFRILTDAGARQRALTSGEIDVGQFSTPEIVAALREDGAIETVESATLAETSYVMLNPNGENEALADPAVRQALAQGIDTDLYAAAIGGGIVETANGPYAPDSPGYLEDTGYPTFDPEAASAAIAEYEEENGSVEIDYLATSDEEILRAATLIAQMWTDIGVDVSVSQAEQALYIPQIFTGDFDAVSFRNHGGFGGLGQRIFWHGENVRPAGEITQNAQRLDDPEINEALDTIRATDDPDERATAAMAINEHFAEQVYDLWLNWTIWSIAHQPAVHQVAGPVDLPDGSVGASFGDGRPGTHEIAQMWIEQ